MVNNIIENFMNEYMPEFNSKVIKSVFENLDKIDKLNELEEDLESYLTSLPESDIDAVVIEFNNIVYKYVNTLINNMGIILSEASIINLDMFLEVIVIIREKNELYVNLILEILTDELEEDIDKVALLVLNLTDITYDDLYNIIEDIESNFINTVIDYLSNSDDDRLLMPEIKYTDTYYYRNIYTGNNTYSDDVKKLLNIIIDEDMNIDTVVNELLGILYYSKDVEDKLYFIDSVIREDLDEYGVSDVNIKTIIKKLNEGVINE